MNIDLVVLAAENLQNREQWKCIDGLEIRVRVNDVRYLIPSYCLTQLLWGMPDCFYPVDKYEWADYPIGYTTVEMVQEVIALKEENFKSFIYYGKN